MFDLIIVCRNRIQAKDLAKRTAVYISSFNHGCVTENKRICIVRDITSNETAHFMTKYDISQGRDTGLRGIRLDGDTFDKVLDGYFTEEKQEDKDE